VASQKYEYVPSSMWKSFLCAKFIASSFYLNALHADNDSPPGLLRKERVKESKKLPKNITYQNCIDKCVFKCAFMDVCALQPQENKSVISEMKTLSFTVHNLFEKEKTMPLDWASNSALIVL